MNGPTWGRQVVAAAAQCGRPDNDGLARVLVAPKGDYFVIHCRVLAVGQHRNGKRGKAGPAQRGNSLCGRGEPEAWSEDRYGWRGLTIGWTKAARPGAPDRQIVWAHDARLGPWPLGYSVRARKRGRTHLFGR